LEVLVSRTALILGIIGDGRTWCDDCLSEKSGITPRQSVNQLCNALGSRGALNRGKGLCCRCGKLKLSTWLTANGGVALDGLDSSIFAEPVAPVIPEPPTKLTEADGEIANLVARFVAMVVEKGIEIYNEFSLQHELGIFLREALPNHLVQFERNVGHFFSSGYAFTKREIDIAVFDKGRSELRYVFELKFPRNGQHPESIFSFCKDVAFIEELRRHGFMGGAAVVFADDRLFYSGSPEGIYKYFRSGEPLTGKIQKPTAKRDEEVMIYGSYSVKWRTVHERLKYACVSI
jgi:hypothetical protein